MKNGVLIFILIIGLGILGYMVVNRNNTTNDIYTYEDTNDIYFPEEETFTPPPSQPIQTTPQPTTQQPPVIQIPTTPTQSTQPITTSGERQESFGISIITPDNIKITSHESAKSVSDGDTDVSVITIPLGSAGLIIEKCLSQACFNKLESDASMRGNEGSVESYTIGGENAIQYHYLVGGIDMYEILIPTKILHITYMPEVLKPYTLEEIKNIISSIRFN